MKVLAYAVTANADGTLIYHCVPEEKGGMIPILFLCKVGDAFVADDLRYLCVGVHACQVVFVLDERSEKRLMGEPACQFYIFLVTGDFGNIGKRFVQSSVFAAEHVLHLLVAEACGDVCHPVGQVCQHPAGKVASGVEVSVAQSGICLMYVVEGHPFTVEVKASGMDIPCFNFFPKLQASGSSSDEAVACGLLCTMQFVQHIVQPAVYGSISGGGIHHGKCREIVPADVSVQSGIFPVGIAWCFGSESGLAQERGEQSVGIHGHDVM